MRVTRLYQESALNIGEELSLSKDDSHRLMHVLRMEIDDSLILFNNEDSEYLAKINRINKKIVSLKILEKTLKNLESPLMLHLGQVISKGEKMDWVIQKATELGVNNITPLFSERSVVHLKNERLDKKREHWQKIAIHAAEQSGRTRVPTVYLPTPLMQWVYNIEATSKLVLDPVGRNTLSQVPLTQNIALLIGPEGGLSEEEVQFAVSQKFTPISLGPRILRTETAALAALTAIQYQEGDLR